MQPDDDYDNSDSNRDLFDAIVQHPTPRMTPYGEQDENGVDWSLLRRNLALSPLERLCRGHAASMALLRMRAKVRRIN